ncbi:phage NrS-1 polymerase family protein [Halostagnicola kamekurae]|uniref:NrS-1 polymerase-like HBD domain-containing protein n=1 Tax=Halostagnicola kamekurae TaxID=619731 RepID=A0A1I6V6J8_9EURY|nr:hypothetical protein [Halostagnicola kamekurae]SFT09256.1 hypothetical protein SAMN04488556_0090 [Halostagnicola kamekurae]
MSESTVSVLPEQLRKRDQWVCWRGESRDGKPTKIPVTPGSGEFASSTDPTTWTSVKTALEYADSREADGVGFVFTDDDPIVGVDLDDCRDPETGDVDDVAQDIIERLDSYTEISPSGTGFHVLIEGELPSGRNRRGSIELYDTARFFTVTGDHLEETPNHVAHRQDALEAIHGEYVQDTDTGAKSESENRGTTSEQISTGKTVDIDVDLEDEELLEKARNASNGSKFERLWKGNTAGYESQSEADMALCCLLAFWTGGDHARVDRLFRQSGLLREKWDDVHYGDGSTYGEKTIERAIANTSEFYDPDTREGSSEASSKESESSTTENRDEPAQNHAYLVEKNRLLSDRVGDLETTLEEKDERIADLEATNEALREQLSDYQEELEHRDQASDPEVDETGPDQDDSIWTRARRFVGEDE